MIALLYYLIVGRFTRCHHPEWETIARGKRTVRHCYGALHEEREVGKWYDLRCKKCGHIKAVET